MSDNEKSANVQCVAFCEWLILLTFSVQKRDPNTRHPNTALRLFEKYIHVERQTYDNSLDITQSIHFQIRHIQI